MVAESAARYICWGKYYLTYKWGYAQIIFAKGNATGEVDECGAIRRGCALICGFVGLNKEYRWCVGNEGVGNGYKSGG